MNKKFLLVVSTIPILLLAGSLAMGDATGIVTNMLSTTGLSISVSDGTLDWHAVPAGGTWASLNDADPQTVTNESLGVLLVNFSYKIEDFTNGDPLDPETSILENSELFEVAGEDQFYMEMTPYASATGEGVYADVLTNSYQVIDSNVPPYTEVSSGVWEGFVEKGFRITMGSPITFVADDLTADISVVVSTP